MEKLNEFIKICNKMYTKQIKKLINILENTNLDKSCKNNLCAAGDLIVDILELMQTNKISLALPCIRNVYEMTLKAIVLEDSEEIRNSYDKILAKTENDGMDKVRRYIAANFNKYFYIIEKEEMFEKTLGQGILTYIYQTLCRYTHATKVNEFVYLTQKDKGIKEIFNYYMVTFLVYPIILVYIDVVCTRLDLKELDTGNFVIYTIITINILNMLFKYKNKIEKIKKFSEKVLGETDELFQVRIEKEKELFNYYTKDSIDLLKNNSIHQTEVYNFLESYLKKYFTKNQLEKLKNIIEKGQ